jgi:chorismate--pyruvate lyase
VDSPTHLWLPGHALNCYEGSARLRSWLTEPGLLTQRMREGCGEAFRMNVLGEFADGREHVREIELCCDGYPWVFAQTRVPPDTLARHEWLRHIGDTPLGEALAAHGRVTRSDFEYARLMPAVPIIARALERARLAPQPLWMRRSTFAVDGAPLLVQEVFYAHTGARE